MLTRGGGYFFVGVLLYALLDWSMLIDRPSFLSFFSLPEHAWISFSSVTFLFVVFLSCILVFLMLFNVIGFGSILNLYKIPVVLGALFVALSALVLLENFIYTFSKESVLYSGRVLSFLYLVLVLAVWLAIYGVMSKKLAMDVGSNAGVWGSVLLGGVLLSGAGYAVVNLVVVCVESGRGGDEYFAVNEETNLNGSWSKAKPFKNIIFFAADGVEASQLSIYTGGDDITPHLSALSRNGLVIENPVTNASVTYGSLTAMLTGRYPVTTKVFRPHQMLFDEDSIKHFPYLLRRLGYHSIQEATPYYADAFDQNMRAGFDRVNQRSMGLWYPGEGTCLWRSPVALVAQRFLVRLWQRFKHLFTLEPPVNPYLLFASPEYARSTGFSDEDRMARVEQFIRQQASSQTPFFAHIHLMGTHCCYKKPLQLGLEESEAVDGAQLALQLREAITESDNHLGRLTTLLDELNLGASTLIVYSSDHTHGWGYEARVPLIFLLPDGPVGRRLTSAQLIDVVPTVLDYMGMRAPVWMEGRSLLDQDEGVEGDRPLFVVPKHKIPGTYKGEEVAAQGMLFSHVTAAERGFDFGAIAMVVCDRWYQLGLKSGELATGQVDDYRGECGKRGVIDAKDAKSLLLEHFRERGISGWSSGSHASDPDGVKTVSNPAGVGDQGDS